MSPVNNRERNEPCDISAMKPETLQKLARSLSRYQPANPVRIMEVCGTHTAEFFTTGVRALFPPGISLIDGPGCPVCVTPNAYLDRAIEIGRAHNVIIATFGDMVRVPSSYSSLAVEKSRGLDVAVVYSPLDALELAADNPDRQVVFLSVGFETTAPGEAVALMRARERNIKNFSALGGNKRTVPAVRALLASGQVNIDAFILPGHVSVIIGSDVWNFISEEFGKPCVVAGFEDYDLITAVLTLLAMTENKEPAKVYNGYARAVRPGGNVRALEIIDRVFSITDSEWRGMGIIPLSGLAIRDEYADFDAKIKFHVDVPPPREAKGCRCGELLRGLIIPPDCGLFGTACLPANPVGACMVSSEGSCSAYYKYGGTP